MPGRRAVPQDDEPVTDRDDRGNEKDDSHGPFVSKQGQNQGQHAHSDISNGRGAEVGIVGSTGQRHTIE